MKHSNVVVFDKAKPKFQVCKYWDCRVKVIPRKSLCKAHLKKYSLGLLDKCSTCGGIKNKKYHLCAICNEKKIRNQPKYREETSPNWKDHGVWGYYVYVLELSDHSFYVGHTSDLRVRLTEHRSNKTKSTAGKNPKLVWFCEFPTRKIATEQESDIKIMRDKDERSFRGMVLEFNDLVKETWVYKEKR